MWAARYRKLMGVVLLLGSLVAAFWITELLAGHVALKRGAVGLIAAGLFMVSGDVAARMHGGEGSGASRYVFGSTGPSLQGLPVSAVGLLLLVLGVVLRNG
jgi:hypothetical protein